MAWRRSCRLLASLHSPPCERRQQSGVEQTGRTGLCLPGSEGRQTQLANVGNALRNRPIEIRPQATPAPSAKPATRVTAGGRTEKCALAKQTQRARRRASAAARSAGHRLDRSRRSGETKPTRAGTLEDRFCGVTAGAASTDSLLAKQSHRVPSPPFRRPPPTPVWVKFTKRSNLRNLNEINDSGSIAEHSRRLLAEQSHRCGTERGRPARSAAKENSGRDARGPGSAAFRRSKATAPARGSAPLSPSEPRLTRTGAAAHQGARFSVANGRCGPGRTSWQRLRFSGSA